MKSIGRIFVGICKCGAWGCFDEFNRLDEAVLSAVSMQIQIIQDSLRSRSGKTTLLEKEVLHFLLFVLLLLQFKERLNYFRNKIKVDIDQKATEAEVSCLIT